MTTKTATFATRFIAFMLCVGILTGCDDFFETTLEIDPPKHNPKLVLNLFANGTDEAFYIRLGKSSAWEEALSLNGSNQDLDKIFDGDVEVFVNGISQTVYDIDTLVYTQAFYVPGGLTPGDKVEVKAS